MTHCKRRLWLTKIAENSVRANRGNEELSFFVRAIRDGRKRRRRRLQMSLVLNNRRRVLNLVCLLCDCLFPKHDLQDATKLPAFQPATLVFNHETLHTEVVYSLQASIISCPRSKRNTYLTTPPAIFPQKIKTSCVHMTKIQNVQNSA